MPIIKGLKKSQKFWDNSVKEFYYDKPSEYLYKFFSAINVKKSKVLDIGCGAGRNSVMLHRLGFDIYGCDLNKKMVQATKKRLPKPLQKNIIVSDMASLPYDNNFFDFVVSNGIFHNAKSFTDFKLAIKGAYRVLKPGGYLLINLFVASGLEKKFRKEPNQKYLYYTKEKLLPIILLPIYKFFEILSKNKLRLVSCQQQRVLVSTGERDVIKAVFLKPKKTQEMLLRL